LEDHEVIWKRWLAATTGVFALAASAIAVAYASMGLEDFNNPAVPFRLALMGSLSMWSMALALFFGALRFLRFARSGRSTMGKRWVRASILGLGLFFPGFVFSLPITLFWANHHWAGEAQSELPAVEISLYIGIAASVICFVNLIKRKPPNNTE
jgi:uncharacterized membrane protein YeiB